MDKDKGMDKGMEEQSPFDETETEQPKLNRDILMDKTGKDLAQMVFDKGLSKFKLSTLERISKPELCDMLLDIKKPDDKPKSRASNSTSKSDNMLDFALSTLQGIKQARTSQEATINPIALNMFKDSAINKIDEARADGKLNNDTMQNVIFTLSGAVIVFDTVIGFENAPKIWDKIKLKLFKKKDNGTKTE